jgi:hypothetical protein
MKSCIKKLNEIMHNDVTQMQMEINKIHKKIHQILARATEDIEEALGGVDMLKINKTMTAEEKELKMQKILVSAENLSDAINTFIRDSWQRNIRDPSEGTQVPFETLLHGGPRNDLNH